MKTKFTSLSYHVISSIYGEVENAYNAYCSPQISYRPVSGNVSHCHFLLQIHKFAAFCRMRPLAPRQQTLQNLFLPLTVYLRRRCPRPVADLSLLAFHSNRRAYERSDYDLDDQNFNENFETVACHTYFETKITVLNSSEITRLFLNFTNMFRR